MQAIDLKGQRFGKLYVVDRIYCTGTSHAAWRCKCDCGKWSTVTSSNLKQGRTKTCGCSRGGGRPFLRSQNGLSNSRAYSIWHGMRRRCCNEKAINYYKYGAIGIQVCERWMVFLNFLEDMGHPPGPGYTLDRYPNRRGNYEFSNCRWATRKQQRANQNRGT